MPDPQIGALALVTLLCLGFNFINGFNDAANSVATTIGARAMTVPAALATAALFNFIGAFLSHKVAYTVATGVVEPQFMSMGLIMAALMAAILWSVGAWSMGLPSSSSHALIAALAGAAMAKATVESGSADVFNWSSLGDVIMALFASPFFGFIAGFVVFRFFTRLAHGVFTNVSNFQANRVFARLQLLSAAVMSLAHGANDAQKTMGLLALALFQAGALPKFEIPLWVTILSAASISLGTLLGGMRVLKTVAKKITEMQPIHGFSAESAGTVVIVGASLLGMPVSTTHVVISSVVGVGFSKSVHRTPRDTLVAIIRAWFLTIPATMALAAAIYFVFMA
ncbi:MAG: inorganic phosphate transporter [Nitrospinota bacterium]|nr:inorganic phosphate transporter [Nitrospinota bacterium]MDH5678553.1 inorganic phosphate transporter [Nitrospinota bacterium]MDH5756651.1 inorganic phosphate transporter [Nitrospinota bacterium]